MLEINIFCLIAGFFFHVESQKLSEVGEMSEITFYLHFVNEKIKIQRFSVASSRLNKSKTWVS